jgi:hypothetical protein
LAERPGVACRIGSGPPGSYPAGDGGALKANVRIHAIGYLIHRIRVFVCIVAAPSGRQRCPQESDS